jgi:rare lipoprotein A
MRKLLAVLTVVALLPLMDVKADAPKTAGKQIKFSKPWFGMASWYGSQWAGKRTACGKIFNPAALTVAHPYLPCGTMVRVTNVRTGHSEFGRVIDRGPYEEGREMDVSERIADRIDLKKYGVEKVKIEVVRAVDE